MEAVCIFMGIVAPLALVVWLAANKDKLRLFDKDRGGPSAFTAMQEFVEPNVKHIIEMKVRKRLSGEDGPANDKSNG